VGISNTHNAGHWSLQNGGFAGANFGNALKCRCRDSDWEADFFAMQEHCCERYRHWLRAKGAPDTLSQQFAFCLEPYLSFIYQYDAGSVLDVLPGALEEFFMDWLMRKVMVKPPEYTQWPPALRLFYRFLSEKGYLDDPEPMIAGLYAIEPAFIAMVKQRS